MRKSFEQIYMRLAQMMAERSTCARLHVGCVITSTDFRYVYGVGYNGNASGLPNGCDSEEPGKCGCFVEGTKVFPAGITHAYRRHYNGDLIQLETDEGVVEVTPNHPLLTPNRGWVKAGMLVTGDQLVGSEEEYRLESLDPCGGSAIEIDKLFGQLAFTHGTTNYSGATSQFHGDGNYGEVTTAVKTGGRYASHIPDLVSADVLGSITNSSELVGSTLNNGVGVTDILHRVDDVLPFSSAARTVQSVKRLDWGGYVYTLGTKQGWYRLQTSGLLVHNCLHAEENAIINCTVPRSYDKVLFCTNLPCPMCAKRIINLGGVKSVFYNQDYRIRTGLELLESVGIEHKQLHLL